MGCEKSGKDREGRWKAWRAPRRARGGEHDDDRGCHGRATRPVETHRVADADGNDSPRETDRGSLAAIKDFVPLASLDDIVFGGWDIFDDNCYEAATTAGVLERQLLEQIKPELEAIRPMPAVFDRQYVKRLDGPNVKKGKNKRDLAEQLRADIRKFKADNGLSRLVLIWCGSTEIYLTESAAHANVDAFEKALEANDETIPSSMIYAYAAIKEGTPTPTRRRI